MRPNTSPRLNLPGGQVFLRHLRHSLRRSAALPSSLPAGNTKAASLLHLTERWSHRVATCRAGNRTAAVSTRCHPLTYGRQRRTVPGGSTAITRRHYRGALASCYTDILPQLQELAVMRHLEGLRYSSIAILAWLAIFSGAAAASTWHVATTGTNNSGCGSASSPCATLQYVLSSKGDISGDTIEIGPGTYSGDVDITNGTNHNNITITTSAAVKTALGTFTRGIPSGTDNRPFFSSGTWTIDNATGVTVEYMRIRYASSPASGWGSWAFALHQPGQTIRYSELWNGTALAIFTIGPYTFSQLYLHDSGRADGDDPDTHTMFMCRNSGCGGARGSDATSWSQGTLVEYSTFGGESDGDQIQLSTGDDASGRDSYIEVSHVDFTGTVDEQIFDTKGSNYVKIHDSNFLSTTGRSSYTLSQAIDCVASDLSSSNFWVWNNTFKQSGSNLYNIIESGHNQSDNNWWIWNNVFHTQGSRSHASGDIQMVGSWGGTFGHLTFVHNTVIDESGSGGVNFAMISAERSDTVIRNNIFYRVFQTNGDSGGIWSGNGNNATVSHNYFDTSGCPGSCTNGSNAVITATSPFTDAATGDYTVRAGAAVIDAGYTGLVDDGFFTPSLDKNGQPRDSSPDIGAYEAATGVPSAPTNVGVVVQ